MSLRDQILAAQDLKREVVEVPEWLDHLDDPIKVEIREISAKGRIQWRGQAYDEEGNLKEDVWAVSLLLACIFDPETGERIFKAEDLDALNEKSDAALAKLLDKTLEINGLKAERSLETVNFSSETPSSVSSAA